MSKLTKAQAKLHQQACDILTKDVLTEDDKLFVLENWQESAKHINSIAGAFFTPWGLARDLAIEVPNGRILDLCAGIGALTFMVTHQASEIVCVELNADYAEVGRKIVPEARWIVGDIFSLPDLGRFDAVISNPPFGNIKRSRNAPRYAGNSFEYHVIDIASDLGDYGAFILPQMSAPFRYSGERHYREDVSDTYRAFVEATGIELGMNCGIDTSIYRDQWRGTSPQTEIVVTDFVEARARRKPEQSDLFLEAAE